MMSAASKASLAASDKKALGQRTSSFQLKAKETPLKNTKPKQTKTKGAAKYVVTKKGSQDITAKKKEKPKFDRDATQKFDNMLDGDLADLPPLPKTMVKIFLSSTFSDMRAERNTLVREVYPFLRDYCASCDLDFQVVDMRWGVTEDSINDHSVEKLCLLEVENCQKTSIGPNFIVLSGDRYGFRPIPVELDVKTYSILQYEATKLNIANKSLFDEWYKLDENAVPNVYVLQPIKSKFTFFGDFSPGCEEPRERDTADWWKTFEAIQGFLRECAEAAFQDELFSSDERHQYFLSVTECEIQDGILRAKDVNAHCLVYKRRLTHLDGTALLDKDASRFIDVSKSEQGTVIDKEVNCLRESLFQDKIKKNLCSSNIKEYSIFWMPGGVNRETVEQHDDYLAMFCNNFVSDCQTLIEKAEEKQENLIMMSNYYTDYDETVHHLKFCLSKCESFCGQETVLAAAKSYVLDQSGRKPLVIHAESGVGKTSIMAMIMKNIPKWLNKEPHTKLIRFLGTTPQCNTINDVLFGVLGQLSDSYDMIMSPINYKTFKKLVEFTPRYLRQIAVAAKQPVIILLDSIDQLYPNDKAYSMDWLPTTLPQNIKLIVSTLPKEHGILANLKKRLPDKACYVEVPLLTVETGKRIVETYLRLKKRSLTNFQNDLLLTVFKKAPNPLFLKLLLDEARKWSSYTPKEDLELAPTVKEAINKLFQNLENKFGYILVSHALGYITVGLSGLTEFEIEDVLSCDDAVLNEVYKYHDPPVPGIVRIPPVLWARIRYDIREYLVERMSQGKKTLNWYHRQFIETAKEKYTNNGKDAVLHQNLADIYLQDNGFKRTITLKHRKGLTINDADRQITPQPFKTDNKRKLACIPYHTLRAHKLIGKDTAKKNIYCNFKFLCTRISAYSVSAVVSDMTEFVGETKDDEIQLLLNHLSVSRDDLTVQLRFAVCLLAYINPNAEHHHLKELQNEAREYIGTKTKPILVPTFPCMAPRLDASSAFQTSLSGLSDIVAQSSKYLLLEKYKGKGCEPESDKHNENTDFALWSSESQELTHVDFGKKPVSQFILSDACVYFVTKTELVSYNFTKAKTEPVPLTDLVPSWDATEIVTVFVSNSDRTAGAIGLKDAVVLVDLEGLKFVQKFSVKDKPIMIQNVTLLNNGATVIVVGLINTSSADDQPQGPENQSFICVFEQGHEEPMQFFALEKELSYGQAITLCEDKWFVIPTKGKCVDVSETETQTQDLPETSNSVHLLVCKIGDESNVLNEIDIPHAVTKLLGHPEETRLATLTDNGSVYSIQFSEPSFKSVVLTVMLNFPIKEITVIWEDYLAFLCSGGGKVTMYNLRTDKNFGAFVAHPMIIKEILLLDQQCITLGANNEMKVWSVATLLIDVAEQNDKKELYTEETLLEQMNVTAIAPSSDGNELITCHDSGFVMIWNMQSQAFLRRFNIGISPNIIHTATDNIVAFHDTKLGEMKILDIDTGKQAIRLPDTIKNIIHSTMNPEKDCIYIVSAAKVGKEQIDVIGISMKQITKTVRLQNSFTYESIELFLSANQRYIVMRHRVSEKEYGQIKEMWKKGGFGDQNHMYRFTAIDLSQGTGALMPCYRQLSKIPNLGVFIQPYRGNIMLISTRRWIILWDIPTGKCDQKPSNVKKAGMFYRPHWLGNDCIGANNVFMESRNHKYLVCGSEDGYVFIYNSESGIPLGSSKPSSKHSAEVHCLAISPNSRWVASSCRSSVLKLWDSTTGVEQFSVRLDAEAQSMVFTPDSTKLVLYTGIVTTRVLIFSVSSGKQSTSQ